MDISVIVPSLNEEKNIAACLETLVKQIYAFGKYEIIVVDGNSEDKTKDVIMDFAKNHSIISLVVEGKEGVAAARNRGVGAARYDHVAFIDADCEAPPNWLAILAENYQGIKSQFSDIAGVGGRNDIPLDANDFLKATGIVLDSYAGSFNSVQGRQFKSPIFTSSLSTSNVLYEKKKIIETGYFDESLHSEAEDADINYRLTRIGYKLLFIPDSFVWHKMRSTPKAWIKNMFRYGKGRARLLKRYPAMWSFSYLLPLFFILAMTSLLFVPFFKVFYITLIYFPILFCFSLSNCLKKKSLALTLQVMFVYLIQHFGYSLGEMYGLINPKIR